MDKNKDQKIKKTSTEQEDIIESQIGILQHHEGSFCSLSGARDEAEDNFRPKEESKKVMPALV